ncbi:MAG TPA: efflux RND transporter periplasmic adaptor subunit [Bryobacterales bacterium]|nr:efflux RND transporter periplasmic adaptor subunit [Bryobacterales bacterium]
MKTALTLAAILALIGLLAWAGLAAFDEKEEAPTSKVGVPTTVVRKGEVTFSVTAPGELQGSNSKMLTAPMAGGVDLILTSLPKPGDIVKAGDTVIEFDTTELSFNLREAEADLAEAEEALKQSRAESRAKEEEANYLLLKARSDLKLAELDIRRNETLAAIVAKQNELALDAARERLRQLTADLESRQAKLSAGIAIQEAAVAKAKVKAATARKMIASMTLKTEIDGYVSLQQNQSGMFMWGMQLPIFQVGDTVRPGMGVAQILDLESWEIKARLAELDRGHLAVGQEASIRIVASPDRVFHGRVTNIGNTSGPPWERRFECKLSIEDPGPELRPGMSARIEIVTAQLAGVLWLPSQALFDRDAQKFVYRLQDGAFAPVDVELMRSGESEAVITGLNENDIVALADPTQQAGAETTSTGATGALPGS